MTPKSEATHAAAEALAAVASLEELDVQLRLVQLLLEQPSTDVFVRRRWATQTKMAAHLGTVPDVLHRAMLNLTEEDLVQIQRHQIQILNRQGLGDEAKLGS